MENWIAEITLGRAHATIEGSGAINILDLVADAAGAAGVTLSQVVIMEPNKYMVGYDLGSAKSLIATITINQLPATE